MEENKIPQKEKETENKDATEKLNAERDISSIDRQEGNLSHGEVGGSGMGLTKSREETLK